MSGWVYIFVNSAVPNHVKVGFTEREPELRARELATTGLPGEYSVAYSVQVENPRQVEQITHRLLGEERYHKEWFQCSIDRARSAIQQAAVGQIVDDEDTYGDEDDSPLIGGHPLGPPLNSPRGIQKEQSQLPPKGAFFVANAETTGYRFEPIPPGHVKYTCPYCEYATVLLDTPIVRCDYCGRTGFLS
jgi:hypothetical protein